MSHRRTHILHNWTSRLLREERKGRCCDVQPALQGPRASERLPRAGQTGPPSGVLGQVLRHRQVQPWGAQQPRLRAQGHLRTPPHQASTENFRISATGQKQSFQLSTGAPEVVLKRAGAPGDRAFHHFPSWEFIFFKKFSANPFFKKANNQDGSSFFLSPCLFQKVWLWWLLCLEARRG